jgi:hypothetical protein
VEEGPFRRVFIALSNWALCPHGANTLKSHLFCDSEVGQWRGPVQRKNPIPFWPPDMGSRTFPWFRVARSSKLIARFCLPQTFSSRHLSAPTCARRDLCRYVFVSEVSPARSLKPYQDKHVQNPTNSGKIKGNFGLHRVILALPAASLPLGRAVTTLFAFGCFGDPLANNAASRTDHGRGSQPSAERILETSGC